MLSFDLGTKIAQKMHHLPTLEQEMVIKKWVELLLSRRDDEVFILNGYAGTGKTTVLSALVATLKELGLRFRQMAPTGRAAKVMSRLTGLPAYTIHRTIYRQKSYAQANCFELGEGLHPGTIFIVDEASMIANDGMSGTLFGTGHLLDDLVHYVFSQPGCKLILSGDTAQLPPVGETRSPAMAEERMRAYGLHVTTASLTQVVRQEAQSGILANATLLRQLLTGGDVGVLPRLMLGGMADIRALPGSELLETLENCYAHYGTDETIVITRSNRQASSYNQGIRLRILGYEEILSGGERLMVAKNNYYWSADCKQMPFIANGEGAVVRRYRRVRELYGFRFADATLRFPDHNDLELDCTVLLDTLASEAPSLDKARQEALLQAVWEDYPEVGDKRQRWKKIKEDRYFNALQIKYAYAVTCHKAQGGQWECVFVDQGYLTNGMVDADYYRWLYTAITRSTRQVYLINWHR